MAESRATLNAKWKPFFLAGGLSSFAFIGYSIFTMVILVVIGGQPETIEDVYSLLEGNRIIGLLRLDILTILFLPLYYVIFFAVFGTLKDTHKPSIHFWSVITFVGITLVLATPSAYSLIALSDNYASSSDATVKNNLIAAGEALRAADLWHNTGAIFGGILVQTSTLAISFIMLKSNLYGKVIGIIGITTHGLDLLHILFNFSVQRLEPFLSRLRVRSTCRGLESLGSN